MRPAIALASRAQWQIPCFFLPYFCIVRIITPPITSSLAPLATPIEVYLLSRRHRPFHSTHSQSDTETHQLVIVSIFLLRRSLFFSQLSYVNSPFPRPCLSSLFSCTTTKHRVTYFLFFFLLYLLSTYLPFQTLAKETQNKHQKPTNQSTQDQKRNTPPSTLYVFPPLTLGLSITLFPSLLIPRILFFCVCVFPVPGPSPPHRDLSIFSTNHPPGVVLGSSKERSKQELQWTSKPNPKPKPISRVRRR